MSLHTLSSLQRPGYRLAVRDLEDATANPWRGTVLVVHGLGEHGGRYAHVAQALRQAGWRVCSYDHYGHGRSDGPRGDLLHDEQLLEDLAAVIDHVRAAGEADLTHGESSAGAIRGSPDDAASGPTRPFVLLGHSLGGLLVARAAQQGLRPVDGVVLSSPALAADLNAVQRLLLATLPRLAPRLRVDNGVATTQVCRDPAVVQAYRDDPLVHRRICARLAAWVMGNGPKVVQGAPQWARPTLLIYAGQDRLVNRRGSDAFAAAAPTLLVQSHAFEDMFHEIFNDPQQAQVLQMLTGWLERLGRGALTSRSG